MEDSTIKDKRICSNCGSDTTYRNPNSGWIQWNHDKNGNWLCAKCYNKLILGPKWHSITNPKNNPRRIGFKKKRAAAAENPRKGICMRCGISGVRTEIHHEQYDDSDPFAHTIELCMKCHFKTKTIYRRDDGVGGWFMSPDEFEELHRHHESV